MRRRVRGEVIDFKLGPIRVVVSPKPIEALPQVLDALVLRFAIMMTYSCRRPRGSTTEFGEQRGEIAAREGPLERLRRVDVVFLEAKKPLTDSTERTEVIRREDLALDDGEIDLNLIEPTGVDGGVDEHELRPPGL